MESKFLTCYDKFEKNKNEKPTLWHYRIISFSFNKSFSFCVDIFP